MTTDDGTGAQGGTAASDEGDRGPAEQYWTLLARTADLVSKLTSLADRYDAAMRDAGPQAEDNRRRVALMRSAASAGRQLIRARAPAAFPPGEQAAPTPVERDDQARSRDVRAAGRDAAAEARDGRAAERDIRVRAVVRDDDLDFSGRFLAACDRDDAAGDRAEARADRRAAQLDREQEDQHLSLDGQARTYALLSRLEMRAVLRQAQGVLMQRDGLTAGEAFEALLLAATGPMPLDVVVDHVLRRAEPPRAQDAT